MKKVGLIDCNNFFVSCERLFRPDLNGKPVVVLSSNDGCVVARSQEIKDRGIPMSVPYFQVKDILSDMGATIFSSNFTLYRDISRRVFSILQREVDYMEQYSIDECFFTLNAGEEYEIAKHLREVVAKEVGIPVSVGVGLSRTQAKFAASQAKKNEGVYLLEDDASWQNFESTKLSEIWGVGRSRSVALADKQLIYVKDYLCVDSRNLFSWFGIEGPRLLEELCGTQKFMGKPPLLPAQSHTSSRSFSAACLDRAALKAALISHLEEVLEKLHKEKLRAITLRVMFYPGRYSDYVLHGVSVQFSLAVPTLDRFLLTSLVNKALNTHFKLGIPYKKAGVAVATVPEEACQPSLFGVSQGNTEALSVVVQDLNNRLGKKVLRIGVVRDVKQASWLPRQGLMSPRYTTDWRSLRTVSAKDTCS
jgi:DNA polymerase V